MHVSALAARKDGSQKQSERTRTRIPQIAIVGAGFVGSTTAYALLNSGMAAEIVLIDRDRRHAEGHVQDLRDAEVFSNATHVFAASSATAALVARQNPRCSSKAILREFSNTAQMLIRSEGSLLLGEDVTLVSRGVSQWESADLRLRGRSEVQTAQSRMADHRTGGCRTDSAARSFLAEAEMGAVVVIIRRVCGEKPLEVALVQGDDVVEQIAPAVAYPAFRNTVLPGALD